MRVSVIGNLSTMLRLVSIYIAKVSGDVLLLRYCLVESEMEIVEYVEMGC